MCSILLWQASFELQLAPKPIQPTLESFLPLWFGAGDCAEAADHKLLWQNLIETKASNEYVWLCVWVFWLQTHPFRCPETMMLLFSKERIYETGVKRNMVLVIVKRSMRTDSSSDVTPIKTPSISKHLQHMSRYSVMIRAQEISSVLCLPFFFSVMHQKYLLNMSLASQCAQIK